ncbi:uncharacterized protein LOC106129816 isoform X3 [Amyelois transitella]|uniref:uncharacterized protein LOC106129816 isoform X3 n=1 Tax=Amyelois transitella TaxID=680683 RepID=UPI00298FD678|nr:uncharacterized protein LOC106129816 isoform X3 [Amyelois transitella]
MFKSRGDIVYKCTVRLLEDTEILECEFHPSYKGKFLLEHVCQQLNLTETDYFGLRYVDTSSQRHWLHMAKLILKQVKDASPILFSFRVKFYPPNPLLLKEDVTRFQIYLQLKRDLLHGRLYCTANEAAMLGALIIQIELGDYDPSIHVGNYVSEMRLLLRQTDTIEARIQELHSEPVEGTPGGGGGVKGMSTQEAERTFLKIACQLDTYGVDPHPVKDHRGNQLYLGINHSGILTFQGSRKTHHFKWSEVHKINFEGRMFIVHLNYPEKKHTVGFKCPSGAACRHVWCCAIEQMLFFTLSSSSEASVYSGGGLFSWGTKFKYVGRTEREILERDGLLAPRDSQEEGCSGGKRKASSVPATPSTPMTGDFGYSSLPRSTHSAPLEHAVLASEACNGGCLLSGPAVDIALACCDHLPAHDTKPPSMYTHEAALCLQVQQLQRRLPAQRARRRHRAGLLRPPAGARHQAAQYVYTRGSIVSPGAAAATAAACSAGPPSTSRWPAATTCRRTTPSRPVCIHTRQHCVSRCSSCNGGCLLSGPAVDIALACCDHLPAHDTKPPSMYTHEAALCLQVQQLQRRLPAQRARRRHRAGLLRPPAGARHQAAQYVYTRGSIVSPGAAAATAAACSAGPPSTSRWPAATTCRRTTPSRPVCIHTRQHCVSRCSSCNGGCLLSGPAVDIALACCDHLPAHDTKPPSMYTHEAALCLQVQQLQRRLPAQRARRRHRAGLLRPPAGARHQAAQYVYTRGSIVSPGAAAATAAACSAGPPSTSRWPAATTCRRTTPSRPVCIHTRQHCVSRCSSCNGGCLLSGPAVDIALACCDHLPAHDTKPPSMYTHEAALCLQVQQLQRRLPAQRARRRHRAGLLRPPAGARHQAAQYVYTRGSIVSPGAAAATAAACSAGCGVESTGLKRLIGQVQLF